MCEIPLSAHSAKENLTSPSTHNFVQTGSFASPRWEATGALVLVGQSLSQPSRWHSGICSGQLLTCRCTCRGTPFPSARRWLWPTWLLRLQTRTGGLGDIRMSVETEEYKKKKKSDIHNGQRQGIRKTKTSCLTSTPSEQSRNGLVTRLLTDSFLVCIFHENWGKKPEDAV